jgi:hypothetical protein
METGERAAAGRRSCCVVRMGGARELQSDSTCCDGGYMALGLWEQAEEVVVDSSGEKAALHLRCTSGMKRMLESASGLRFALPSFWET